jgi:hypothetical protein
MFNSFVGCLCETEDTRKERIKKMKESSLINFIHEKDLKNYYLIIGLSKEPSFEVKKQFPDSQTIDSDTKYGGIKINILGKEK